MLSEGVLVYNGLMRKKVKAKWGINILGNGKFLVKQGEDVLRGHVLVKIKDKKIQSFDFSGFLGKLSQLKLEELNNKFSDSWINNGELICLSGGIFPSKICFPMSGRFIGLDEFGILKIEEESENEREVLSPVNSKVLKIEKDKISLGFEVYEFKGEGLVGGKVWAKGKIEVLNKTNDLDFNLKGGLLFTDNLSRTFLLKAEVVGINGIVTNVKNEDITTDLPTLFLDDKEWQNLFKSEGKTENFLLNSRLGRLLMVVE